MRSTTHAEQRDARFLQATERAQAIFARMRRRYGSVGRSRRATTLTDALQRAKIARPQTWAALDTLASDIAAQVRAHGDDERQSRRPPCRTCATTCIWSARRSALAQKSSGCPPQDAAALLGYQAARRQLRPSTFRSG